MSDRRVYPFSAIVGQETLKTALLINAVDPRVGGVLIRGEKGTAKSTAVRALASLLPEIEVVEGCRFGCDPRERNTWCPECRSLSERPRIARRRPSMVELPVAATEDRLVGTLDLEHALKHGERRFEPGLLAQANRGLVYVDEVNLLDDHLVDTLLDAAAMGVNTVEREGISYSHPARFALVGTMNPEEGEVRPQLLDRFGLCVDVASVRDPALRVEVIRRRREFDDDPAGFLARSAPAEESLREILRRASSAEVHVSDEILLMVATVCAQMGVDGHRADLTMTRAAAALAALEGRDSVDPADVERVAGLVLAHRVRRSPFQDASLDRDRLREVLAHAAEGADGISPGTPPPANSPGDGEAVIKAAGGTAADADAASVPGARLVLPLDQLRRSHSGRRQETVSTDRRGRYSRAERSSAASTDIALDATIRAAAPNQSRREGDLAIRIEPADVRTKVRTRRVGASIVFCVDASGSMGAASRIEAAKGAVLELLVDAYQRRDRVGVVSFRGDGAEILLQPTASVEMAQLKLRSLETGGATPLAHGMLRALDVLNAEMRRSEQVIPWLVLVTDGGGNVGLSPRSLGSEDARTAAGRVRDADVNVVVIDTANSARGGSSAVRELARAAGGEYVRLPRVDARAVTEVVRARLAAG